MPRFCSLQAAVHGAVHDGDIVAMEGFTHLIPFAAAHEVIRQGRRDLTLVRMTPDLIYDQMIGAGCAAKLVFSWGGNPGVGSLHRLRDATEHGWPRPLALEEYSHAALANAYDAGAAHLPFAALRGSPGDLVRVNPNYRSVTCPFTGEHLTTVPAMRPDVGIIHAQRADREGNVLIEGIIGVQKEAVLAASRSIVTVEEIVERFDDEAPNTCVLPHWTIGAIAVVPGGAFPSYAYGYYGRDNAFYIAWDAIARDRDTFRAWIDEHVLRRGGLARAAAGVVPVSGAAPKAPAAARTNGRPKEPAASTYSPDELMTVAAARCLGNTDVCFVGIGLPSAACNLARLTHAPRITLIYESGTIGARPSVLPLSIGDGELCATALTTVSVPEFFRYWLQSGRITIGFLGAAQIDRFANLNTTVVGTYEAPAVRLPGGGGAPEMAAACQRIFIVMPQSKRAFVQQLDFLTSFGHGEGGDHRTRLGMATQGPVKVITDLCVMEPDPQTRELTVTSLHPGATRQQVEGATGWTLRFAPDLAETPAPSQRELEVLRRVRFETGRAHLGKEHACPPG
jgi:acyl CoA:acetate/3-ketoacid CoA transferase beta subunit/acyl CoA:acetate/3-ketoacid CoA transferase alpha subunit